MNVIANNNEPCRLIMAELLMGMASSYPPSLAYLSEDLRGAKLFSDSSSSDSSFLRGVFVQMLPVWTCGYM